MLLAIVFLVAGGFAAPDEAALGKDEGYPICPASLRPETRCLVSLVSRFDEVFPARKVARAPQARPLKRAAAEPAFRYTTSHRAERWTTTSRTTAPRAC